MNVGNNKNTYTCVKKKIYPGIWTPMLTCTYRTCSNMSGSARPSVDRYSTMTRCILIVYNQCFGSG